MWRMRTSPSRSMPTQCSVPPASETAAGSLLHLATNSSRIAARTSACCPCGLPCKCASKADTFRGRPLWAHNGKRQSDVNHPCKALVQAADHYLAVWKVVKNAGEQRRGHQLQQALGNTS